MNAMQWVPYVIFGSVVLLIVFSIVVFNLRYLRRADRQSDGQLQPPPEAPPTQTDWRYMSRLRLVREGAYSNMSPRLRRFQKTLWWLIGIGWVAAVIVIVTGLIILRLP